MKKRSNTVGLKPCESRRLLEQQSPELPRRLSQQQCRLSVGRSSPKSWMDTDEQDEYERQELAPSDFLQAKRVYLLQEQAVVQKRYQLERLISKIKMLCHYG